MLRWLLTQETSPNGTKPSVGLFALRYANVFESTQFRRQFYEDLVWLQKHRYLDVPSLRRWSKAVQEVARDVLEMALCRDIVDLVKAYC